MIILAQGSCINVKHSIDDMANPLIGTDCPSKEAGEVLWAWPPDAQSREVFEKVDVALGKGEEVWVLLRVIASSRTSGCNLNEIVLVGKAVSAH
ncbi:MAG: hypothetical protein QXP31_04725, partial [Pyrobaculum sp.]